MPRNDSSFDTSTFNQITLLATTASINPTTGALIVPGGVGISGDLNVGGAIVGGAITYGSTSTGTLDVTNTPGTTFTVQSTEESTAVGTGSSRFLGGVSIAKNLYVGGNIVAGAISYASTTTGTLTVTNSPGNTLIVDSTEDSVSKVTGSATFKGGIGVDKNISAASIKVFNTTQSTSPTTGAILSGGGIGAVGNITAGGNVFGTDADFTGNVRNGGYDLILGNTNQVDRGNSGLSRALVKDAGNILKINFAGDYLGGVSIAGPSATVSGTLTVLGQSNLKTTVIDGTATATELIVVNNGTMSGLTVNGTATVNGPFFAQTSTLTSITVSGTSNLNTATAQSLTVDNNAEVDTLSVNGQQVLSYNVGTPTLINAATNSIENSGEILSFIYSLREGGSGTIRNLARKAFGADELGIADANIPTLIRGTTVRASTFDLRLGILGDVSRGDSGLSRALYYDNSATLVLNYLNDFTGGVRVDGNLTVKPGFSFTVDTGTFQTVTASSVVNSGFDFKLGNGDQVTRGNSGASRALVKDTGNVLTINFNNDFNGGVVVSSKLTAQGNLRSTDYYTKPIGATIETNGTLNNVSVEAQLVYTGTIATVYLKASFLNSGGTGYVRFNLTGTNIPDFDYAGGTLGVSSLAFNNFRLTRCYVVHPPGTFKIYLINSTDREVSLSDPAGSEMTTWFVGNYTVDLSFSVMAVVPF